MAGFFFLPMSGAMKMNYFIKDENRYMENVL
jgi:hypothetical protein